MQMKHENIKNKFICILLILITFLLIGTYILAYMKKNSYIENLMSEEIYYFSSAANEFSNYKYAELNNNQFNSIFLYLGSCYSYSESIRFLTKDHQFMYSLINEYTLELKNLGYDQGIYKNHSKEYYNDVISDFLVISNWLEENNSSKSYDKISFYEFNLNIRPNLSDAFEEYMDF